MKNTYLLVICYFWAIQGYSQLTAKQQTDSIDKENRRANVYANRKYSLSVGLNPYTNVSHGGGNNIFGAIDLTFSDRLVWLDVGKNASLETNFGIGFQPYQGTRLNLGCDYELLSKKYRVNLYAGGQYSLGLDQVTSMEDNSSIKVGFHHYGMPFVGLIWWPGKNDETDDDVNKVYRYHHPGFGQLIYFKLQVGYSFLLNKVSVDTTGAFDPHLYQLIRNNTANTLNVKICVGINIPTGEARRSQFLQHIY